MSDHSLRRGFSERFVSFFNMFLFIFLLDNRRNAIWLHFIPMMLQRRTFLLSIFRFFLRMN